MHPREPLGRASRPPRENAAAKAIDIRICRKRAIDCRNPRLGYTNVVVTKGDEFCPRGGDAGVAGLRKTLSGLEQVPQPYAAPLDERVHDSPGVVRRVVVDHDQFEWR
jgi:hypothetical protein